MCHTRTKSKGPKSLDLEVEHLEINWLRLKESRWLNYDFTQPIHVLHPHHLVSVNLGIENEISSSGLTVFWQYQKSCSCSSDSEEINRVFWGGRINISSVGVNTQNWLNLVQNYPKIDNPTPQQGESSNDKNWQNVEKVQIGGGLYGVGVLTKWFYIF